MLVKIFSFTGRKGIEEDIVIEEKPTEEKKEETNNENGSTEADWSSLLKNAQ